MEHKVNSQNIYEYDYIVVGSATGGVVASRLSEAKNKVLLIEAGPNDLTYSCNSCNALPFGNLIPSTPLLPDKGHWYLSLPDLNWNDAISMPSYWNYNKTILNRTENLIRAKMLGGCLSHNRHGWWRGSTRDYDYVAQYYGLSDWSFDKIMSFYQKIETYLGENKTLRGNNGPIELR